MIPSDHFVRFYNEVFKALEELGHEHPVRYWRELGRLKVIECAEDWRRRGLDAASEYWTRIMHEENCVAEASRTDDYFDFCMHQCPSLSKVLDNDAMPCELYCDHCMVWIQPLMEAAGLYAVMDMHSRSEPHCHFRVYRDKRKAEEFERSAILLSLPYEESGR